MPVATYLRWRAPVPNRRGFFPGIFALVNGLAQDGELTPEEEQFRTVNNAWFHANVTDPVTVIPDVYDRARNPGAAAWWKPDAHDCLTRVPGYLSILVAHKVPCELEESASPGVILYEDACQVIAKPVQWPAQTGAAAAPLRYSSGVQQPRRLPAPSTDSRRPADLGVGRD